MYRQEFPDFDHDLPEIPGLVDQSWHNDVCPHFEGHNVELWCDYATPALREFPDGKIYTLHNGSAGDGASEVIAESDDLDAILVELARYQIDAAVLALPVDLLNMLLDMRVTASEAQFGKASYADVCEHARKLARELRLRATIGETDNTATWSRA